MIAIVESGSTKADWKLINSKGTLTSYTKGLNPYMHSEKEVLNFLNENDDISAVKDDVTELFFYGAGCSTPKLKELMKGMLQKFFLNAKVSVDHDLAAAALSCYSGRPLIACIIGTGSNSCYFNGLTVHEEVPALGHLLGDEGSGSYFGKRLLADYLYNRLPIELSNELKNRGLNKQVIIENVYMKPGANVYVASFAEILIKYKDLDYSKVLIKKGFQEFIDIHVKCYKNYKTVEVHFIGSIASLLKKELEEVCEANEVILGKIIRRPLEHLVQYHLSKSRVVVSSL